MPGARQMALILTVVTMGLGLESVASHIDYLANLASRLNLQ